MSSQSSTSPTTRLGRRSAAALGTSALFCLALAGPALSVELPDPVPGVAPSAPQTCVYVGGGTVASCGTSSSTSSGSGAGSASAAERGTPDVVAPVTRRIVLPSPEPSDLPAIGLGVAAAVVVAGGLVIASTNRRRAA
ncbi:hypothetical protein LJR027_004134 [Terrabacter sp. LjRoot27]|uniref:hypothetical protein n=1 Tax=Terrabacter sp. LjRoot27 TaxID=3342306 RepID=UPI003ECDB41D